MIATLFRQRLSSISLWVSTLQWKISPGSWEAQSHVKPSHLLNCVCGVTAVNSNHPLARTALYHRHRILLLLMHEATFPLKYAVTLLLTFSIFSSSILKNSCWLSEMCMLKKQRVVKCIFSVFPSSLRWKMLRVYTLRLSFISCWLFHWSALKSY